MKRPSDRKSVYLRVRITKAERAWLRKKAKAGEGISDTVRRLLFAATPPVAGRWQESELGWLLTYHVEQDLGKGRRPTWVKGVECKHHSTHRESREHHEFTPTHDPNEAWRFARKQDAETALEIINLPWRGLVKVEEHMWPAASGSAGAAPTKQQVEALPRYQPVKAKNKHSGVDLVMEERGDGNWIRRDDARALFTAPPSETREGR